MPVGSEPPCSLLLSGSGPWHSVTAPWCLQGEDVTLKKKKTIGPVKTCRLLGIVNLMLELISSSILFWQGRHILLRGHFNVWLKPW